MLLTLLRCNGAECYLAGLSQPLARKATLDLARLLEQLIPEEDCRMSLFDGTRMLSEYPEAEEQLLGQIAEVKDQLTHDLSLLVGR